MRKISLIAMIEAAFLASLAFIFDLLPSIRITPAISISFAMVPILLLAFRRGVMVSFLGGFIWGLLQIVSGDAAGSILTPLQGFIEYFIAFAFVGVAGFFSKPVQNQLDKGRKGMALGLVVLGTFIGSFSRYFWHFVAGFIFWGEYAPESMNPVFYSFIVNGSTMLGATVLCAVLLVILINTAPRLIQPKEIQANTNQNRAV